MKLHPTVVGKKTCEKTVNLPNVQIYFTEFMKCNGEILDQK